MADVMTIVEYRAAFLLAQAKSFDVEPHGQDQS